MIVISISFIICLLTLKASLGNIKKNYNVNTAVVRSKVAQLSEKGQLLDIITYLRGLESQYKTLRLDDEIPSLYSFLGVALYQAQKYDEAINVFQQAVHHFPNESRAWINLGEIQVQVFKLMESIQSFEAAYKVGEVAALPRMVRTKGWSMAWKDMDLYTSYLEKSALECYLTPSKCIIDSTGGFEYTDIPGVIFKFMTSASPNNRIAQISFTFPITDLRSASYFKPYQKAILALTTANNKNNAKKRSTKSVTAVVASSQPQQLPRLKIGFISSDFGIHPVATLIRGFLQLLNQSKYEIYCFSVHPKVSWWGQNITSTVEHFITLQSEQNLQYNAEIVASYHLDIMIDLNGHTMKSGLPILSYRVAPIQISYLGLPSTTAAQFIDYFIGDYISLPPEQIDHFSEKVILMNICYIVNDYAATQGAIAYSTPTQRAPRISLGTTMTTIEALYTARILLGTLANSMKIDPMIFHVWMNIMQIYAGSKMIFMEYYGHDTYYTNILQEGAYYGISADRLLLVPQLPWIDHLLSKTSIDLLLDSYIKTTHTTGLDGIWAGVPTITLAGGNSMASRAGESMARTLGSELGVTFSLKDYEDLAISLMRKNWQKKPQYNNMHDVNKERIKKGYYQAQDSLQQEIHHNIVTNTATATTTTTTATANEEEEEHIKKTKKRNKDMPSTHIHTQLQQDFPLLLQWRTAIAHHRHTSLLYHTSYYTKQFELLMEGTWEAAYVLQQQQQQQQQKQAQTPQQPYHIFALVDAITPTATADKTSLVIEQIPSMDSNMFPPNLHTYIHPKECLTTAIEMLLDQEAIVFHIQRDDNDNDSDSDHSSSDDNDNDESSVGNNIEGKEEIIMNNDKKKKKKKTEIKTKSNAAAATATTTGSAKSIMHGNRNSHSSHSGSNSRKFYSAIPNYVYDGRYIFLNIGGMRETQDWLNVNTQKYTTTNSNTNPNYHNINMKVDILRDMSDLHGILNNSVSAVYSSHTLEHVSWGNIKKNILITLQEWFRILRPGGLLLISVPNLTTLAKMYLDPKMTMEDRVMIMKMMYGAQSDEHDYHYVGFNAELLSMFLSEAGFCQIQHVKHLNIGFKDKFNHPFTDTSELVYKGYFVSLNMVAKVCTDSKPDISYDGFSINHNAILFDEDEDK